MKYLSNFWKALEILLINCEINLFLTWSARYFVIHDPIASQEPTLAIAYTKLYVPISTLSTQDNQNYLNNKNLVLKEQLTGININQKFQ